MGRNNKDNAPIRINRKMRMWHKYKLYFITFAALVSVALALVIVLNVVKTVQTNIANSETTTPEPATFEQITEPPTTEEPTTMPAGFVVVEGEAVKESYTAKELLAQSAFLGDSVIIGMENYGYIEKKQVFGDVNATSGKLEDYVSKAVANKPDKLFIMVGHNDANYGTIKEEKLLGNINTLVAAAKAASESTKVYVLSITPVTSGFEAKSNVKQKYIDNVNDMLKEEAAQGEFTYIDIATAFKDESGYMKSDYSSNGINITHSYYPFVLNGIAAVAE